MPNARIPQLDPSEKSLNAFAKQLGELAEKRCSDPSDFEAFTQAAMARHGIGRRCDVACLTAQARGAVHYR